MIIMIFAVVNGIVTDGFSFWLLGYLAFGLVCVIASLMSVHLSVYLMLHEDHLDVSRFVPWSRNTKKSRVSYERVLSITTHDSGEVDIVFASEERTHNSQEDVDSTRFMPDDPAVISEIKRRVQLAVTAPADRR